MTKWVEELEKENRKIKKEYSEYVDAKEMELKHATYTCSQLSSDNKWLLKEVKIL